MAGVTASLVSMPNISNYTQLVSELQSLLQRDDVGEKVKTFSRTVEAEVNRRLSHNPVRPAINQVTFTANGPLPARFLAEVDVICDGVRIEGVDISFSAHAQDKVNSTQDRFYVLRGNTIEFFPALVNETVSLTYVERIIPLSDVQPVNWLLTDHPDVYLYGCAAYADIWEDDDQRARDFLSLFDRFLDSALSSYPVRNETRLRLDDAFPMYPRRRVTSW